MTNIELINQRNIEYAATIDRDRIEEWPSFFTENAKYIITTRSNYALGRRMGIVYGIGRKMIMDRVTALRHANMYEQQSYCHVIGGALKLSESESKIVTESSFIVVRSVNHGQSELFVAGVYKDVWAVTNEGLYLNERIVVCESDVIETLLAIPI
ncbi:MAG: terephthalate 1,2-dioxygenase [Comamonadaceae bacterium]|nr:terephthalate 1,2-dioxygenase [Comamonadaceae bacterium]